MPGDPPEPMEGFEGWLLRRVARAVEAGEVSADLLTDLQNEIEAARDRPPAEGYDQAIHSVAEIAGMSTRKVEEMLTAVEAQPSVIREQLMRQFVEAWLEGQRKAYRTDRDGGEESTSNWRSPDSQR